MKTIRKNKGFTLIEMLVVIAIIAVLVGVAIPVVSNSTTKAKAATDAANMRTIHAMANSILYGTSPEAAIADIESRHVECRSFKDAKLKIVFVHPAFVEIYFVVDDSAYYGLDYFTEVAQTGSSTVSTARPEFPGAQWYIVGESREIPVP